MSNEKDLDELKKEAAAKAKEAALAKLQAKKEDTSQLEQSLPVEAPIETEEEKKKRLKQEAVAKAKAAAQAKLATKKEDSTIVTESTSSDETEEEKKKRLKQEAVAKAKAAAQAKKQNNVVTTTAVEQTSKNNLVLEKYIQVIEEHVGKDVIKEAYINFLSKEVPTIIIDPKMYFRLMQFLRFNEQLAFDMLVELHASDIESSMELYLYLYSTINKQHLVLKTLLDRDQPSIESVSSLWPGANWPECEAYDLLGVHFTGHPYLHRLLLGEDWKGYPLRKDYKAYDDVEV